MTHFATADDDPAFMREQLERFLAVGGQSAPCATPRTRPRRWASPAARLDMIRCGIAIYGMDPFHLDPAEHGLEPALELVSYVAEVKRARTGESVGYGRRFVAERDTWIGTIPIGYGDGYRRGLTGRFEVLVGGGASRWRDGLDGQHHRRPRRRAGRARHRGGADRRPRRGAILAEDLARALGTINYEVTCGISRAACRGRVDMSEALGGSRARRCAGEDAWLVGGAVRDQLLGRDTDDIDLAVPGDPKPLARKLARAAAARRSSSAARSARGASSAPEHAWHVDLVTLRDDDIHADLAQRDFTINAMAEPLEGGELLDPHGGREDLPSRLVRMVSAQALADDPLRSLRAVRIAVELGLELDAATGRAVVRATRRGIDAGRARAGVRRAQARRLRRRRPRGLAMMDAHGLTDVVLPELTALQGHRAEPLPPRRRPRPHARGARRGQRSCSSSTTRCSPSRSSDELTRGEAMRWAALLHDAAKPQTRGLLPGGRVTFLGHDAAGAQLARDVLGRLRSSAEAARLRRRAHRCTTSTPASSSTSARSTAARSGATCRRRGPTARTSRSSPSPTASPPAAPTPSRRSRPTWRWPASCSPPPASRSRKPLVRGDELVARPASSPARGWARSSPSSRRTASRARSSPARTRWPARRSSRVIELAARERRARRSPGSSTPPTTPARRGSGRPAGSGSTPEQVAELIAAGEIAVARGDGAGSSAAVRVRRLDEDTAELGMLSVDPARLRHGRGARAARRSPSSITARRSCSSSCSCRVAPRTRRRSGCTSGTAASGYVQISRREFDEPLLAGPADLRTYRKSLRAAPAT